MCVCADGEWVECDGVWVRPSEGEGFLERMDFLVGGVAPLSMTMQLAIGIDGEQCTCVCVCVCVCVCDFVRLPRPRAGQLGSKGACSSHPSTTTPSQAYMCGRTWPDGITESGAGACVCVLVCVCGCVCVCACVCEL